MLQKTIQQLISGTYTSRGGRVSVPVKAVRIDSGISDFAADLIAESGLSGSALVVSDVNTNEVLAAKIVASLGAGGLVFENGVKADISNVEKIKDAAKSADYIVAVGSGTINDLCKYASYQLQKPYVVFGTAPSMNGYGSANASIKVSGHKKTLKAHLPSGIFLDLDILVKAPVRLIRSGLGDSVCRSTAQADWLLSHLLLDTYYNEVPFELLRPFEMDLFANTAALVKGNIEAMRNLASTLVLSGFGMYISGGSYPASQGEHMIAHTMEMACGDSLPVSYHGEQIAVTTLTMAKLQEQICQLSGLSFQNIMFPAAWNMEPQTLKECQQEYAAKQFSSQKLDEINHRISNSWGDIAQKILEITIPCNTIYNSLKSVGCPVEPKDIGWQLDGYEKAVSFAKYTRDRFTFLDLV